MSVSKKALITGASAGIGATYADRLARRGLDLVLVARGKQRLDALAARLAGETGVAVEVVAADLSVPADLDAIARRLRDDAGITMLVNNAGMTGGGAFSTADLARVQAMLQLNVLALTALTGAAVARMVGQGGCSIINISSVLALAPERFDGAYGASKAYVLNFTQSLHNELGPQGLRVQAVLPGMTRTDIWAKAGVDAHALPAEMLMDVGPMVDAALAGYDMGEVVTLPALPDVADWDAFTRARLAMTPNLSHAQPAARYRAMSPTRG